ncbi:ferredoxin [Candidatus Pacearchaeota archaeon]|nr:ferredoxin [Candidatus Pacearchaeota archaeon]
MSDLNKKDYNLTVDKKKCIGCGACVAICPKVFKLNKGKAEATVKKIKNVGEVLEAETACPAQAIKISK